MPELPETETIARDLDRTVSGATIASVKVHRADVLRDITAAALSRRVAGARIQRSYRRAKAVVILLDTNDRIVVQPRFTGALLVDDGTLPAEALSYLTVSFSLHDGRALAYRDIRRLGTVALMSPARFAKFDAALGPEPLDPAFTPQHLSGILRDSRQAVKKLLMDQRRVAGVGNIYANEALWRAGIDPSRAAHRISEAEAASLHAGLTSVLREAIVARGTSFRDYRDASGARGGFAGLLAAYGRGGLPCRRCGATLINTSAIDGRTTVFCARCQR
ncbi:MAG TPA: bifunctional DNA-formamidopyrimidine glycosylase/DNA-(apurinic or apyrimidinic site) lyase [Gemmatimonadaceae bacterium]|nr:bifunctional DNA-formamidopyrimidine glycosylase/DNA-(apurinic or apyrimidinic site) lyase [Gemmatimonadaceae bacterium]